MNVTDEQIASQEKKQGPIYLGLLTVMFTWRKPSFDNVIHLQSPYTVT